MTKGKTRRPNGESGARASTAALQQTSALTSTSEQPFILSQRNNSQLSTSRWKQHVANVSYFGSSRRPSQEAMACLLESSCREPRPQ
jgi:hypothetical protein